MSEVDLPIIPARRNVKWMSQRLTEAVPGEGLSVTFRTSTYGPFRIQGRVIKSSGSGALMVAGLPIESNLKPDKAVLSLKGHDLLDLEATEIKGEAAANDVTHGAIVRAVFEQDPYGRFIITGPVVDRIDGAVKAVGGWFIWSKAGGRAARLLGVETIAAATEHGLPVPGPMSEWMTSDPL